MTTTKAAGLCNSFVQQDIIIHSIQAHTHTRTQRPALPQPLDDLLLYNPRRHRPAVLQRDGPDNGVDRARQDDGVAGPGEVLGLHADMVSIAASSGCSQAGATRQGKGDRVMELLTSLGFHLSTFDSPISIASLCILSGCRTSRGAVSARLVMPSSDGCWKGLRPYRSGSGSTGVAETMSFVTSRMTACRPAGMSVAGLPSTPEFPPSFLGSGPGFPFLPA